ncbi:MAG: ABC transporter ATP-binding protein/permease [Deferribacteraceae bacterium]|nr:ABC transporter ATP-binding protein/permease [Deferribacteraceae bacterium]
MLTNSPLIHAYRRMWPFIKPYSFRALLGMLLTIPVGAFDAAIAAFLRPFMDVVMVEQQSDFTMQLPIIIICFTLMQGVLIYAASYFNSWVGAKITTDIRTQLFDKLLSMHTAHFDQQSSGAILRRYSQDAERASGSLINNLKLFLTKFFSSITLTGVLLYNSWQLAIIAVGTLALVLYPLKAVKQKLQKSMNADEGAGANVMTIYNEAFNGNKIIHSFTLEPQMRGKFDQRMEMMFDNRMRIINATSWLSSILHFISSLGVALVVGFGGYLITVSHSITPGAFVAFVAAMLMLYAPLKSIGGTYVDMQRSFMAIDRIFQIFQQDPAIKDGALVLDKVRDGIEFKNVSFAYIKKRKVLKNISFDVKLGQTIALVGNSGGGKSTISNLIPRLYDTTGGEILIDGVNIKDYTIKSLRSHIAVVFQDNFLFSGTIRENLALGAQNVSEEAMWQALRNANLDEFVDSLENKLDTEIGERGTMLSGGQKQRIAIARAFIKDAPIVILDEATSALDNKAERVVQQALDKLMENRTVIVIAHRLSTIQNANKILVINEGEIIEQGAHDELLKQQGAYYALYETQFKT